MKHFGFIPLALWLTACSTPSSHRQLTAAEAAQLARNLANEKAQALYRIQPFDSDLPAEAVADGWAWHARKGRGAGDYEASVKFAGDGSRPDIKVFRLFDQTR